MMIKDIPWYNRPGVRIRKKGASSLLGINVLDHVIIAKDNSMSFKEKGSLS